jgi:hypothetical protein
LAVNDLLQARKMVKLNPLVLTTPQMNKGGDKGDKGVSPVHERSQSSLPPILAGSRNGHQTERGGHQTERGTLSETPREQTENFIVMWKSCYMMVCLYLQDTIVLKKNGGNF